jgi:hypothetical protein
MENTLKESLEYIFNWDKYPEITKNNLYEIWKSSKIKAIHTVQKYGARGQFSIKEIKEVLEEIFKEYND